MSDLFDYMDRYFNGEMTPAEKEDFHRRCQSDPAFAEELASYIAIHDYVKQQGRRRQQQDWDTPVKDPQAGIGENGTKPVSGSARKELSRRPGRKRILRIVTGLAVAASIISIVLLTLTWYNSKKSRKEIVYTNGEKKDTTAKIKRPDTAHLRNVVIAGGRNKDKDSGKITTRKNPALIDEAKRNALFTDNFKPAAAPAAITEPLQQAFDQYRRENYKGAIASIEEAERNQLRGGEQTDEEELAAFYRHYYKAQSYLALKNTGKAIAELKTSIDSSPNDSLKSSARWYLALAYLKRGDIKRAVALLKELSRDSGAGDYKRRSANLIRQIKISSTIIKK